ncbi:hypothetical protein COCCADRAFT_94879, partial [Bipolaris zeicola 26-R-13]
RLHLVFGHTRLPLLYRLADGYLLPGGMVVVARIMGMGWVGSDHFWIEVGWGRTDHG